MITKSITEAQQYFEDIQFTAEDSTRADKKFLIEIISTVVKLGVKTISLPDTVGCMTPEEYYNLISFIKKNVKGNYILSCHCHNDLGLATANTFFGITAGAQQVEVCVNGIGERAGNCPLEEIVMLLHLKTNYRTDIKTKLLFKTSKLVSKESTMIMQTNKAIVGEKIFSHKSGIHQHGILIEPSMYEIIDFKSVGRQKREIVIGKHSGEFAKKASIQKKYQRTNIFTYL
jgi:2-isopropylmalate synthase